MLRILWLMVLSLGIMSLAFSSDVMPIEFAFHTQVLQVSNQFVNVEFTIAPDYQVYKNKIRITTTNYSSAKVGAMVLPKAIMAHNDILGNYEVYMNKAIVKLPITNYGNNKLVLSINYEGCKGGIYCYPPVHEVKTIILQPNFVGATAPGKPQSVSSKLKQFITATNSSSIEGFFINNVVLVILAFFAVGLLLTFTPCVFPMLPILFTIIAGNGAGLKRSTLLSGSYVLGMAIAYAVVGAAVAEFGSSIQATLQSNMTNYIVGVLFVVFSLSLFGLFEIRLPGSLQQRLAQRKSGKSSFIGSFITGFLSTLILSPCVTAPLAGALLYIATTGNVLLGSAALFAMGIGSGVPLLVIAVFGNKVLPKTGGWMLIVRDFLGVIMLCMAAYVSLRSLSIQYMLCAFSAILLIFGVYLLCSHKHSQMMKSMVAKLSAIIVVVVATCVFYQQLANVTPATNITTGISLNKFTVVNTLDKLNLELAKAKAQNKPVMLDFSAEWCLSCKELDAKTFTNARVIELLNNFYPIKVDVTSDNAGSKLLEKTYQVFASPSLIFIDSHGSVLKGKSVDGFISADKLIPILQSVTN